MNHLPVVPDRTSQSLSDLVGCLAEALRAQSADLDAIRALLEPMFDEASGCVPLHTLEALVDCLHRESACHARTVRNLSAHLTALDAGSAPCDTPPARLARLLGRRRFEEENMLGFLDFAERATAGYALPESATPAQRTLYAALAEWDHRERDRLRVEADLLVPVALALEHALGRDAEVVSLEVHHRDLLAQGGCRHEASVFCPVERASVGVEWCRGCPLVRRVSGQAVECTPGAAPSPGTSDPVRLGTGACVGEVMGTRQFSVLPEVPARDIVRALRDTPGAPVVVVDDGDRLLGVIEPFVAASAPLGARASALRHDRSAITESASLADAVDLMVKGHARSLPVVRSDGRVVGMLSDLDALRWVASHAQRRRVRP
jgi:CBS domain-containing protein